MNIRTFRPGDEPAQVAVFNAAACTLPGFKPALAADVLKRTRARGFDPECRFYAVDNGQVVGYCVLEPEQARVSVPWCKKGHEAVATPLFDAVLSAARDRHLSRVFAAYRRDWDATWRFFADHGFAHARDFINYSCDPIDMPTAATWGGRAVSRLERADLPALAEMGRGVIRLPAAKLEQHFFSNPYFPAEALLANRGKDGELTAVAMELEQPTYADVRKIDPLAPCFRLGAVGPEGVSVERVHGMFSFLVANPELTASAGLGLLAEVWQEMTEGTVHALAAQCPSDVPHLVGFYSRYFKEQGRFPVWERQL